MADFGASVRQQGLSGRTGYRPAMRREELQEPNAWCLLGRYAEKVAQGWGFLQGDGYVGFGPGHSQGTGGYAVYEFTCPGRKLPLLSPRIDTSGRTPELGTTPLWPECALVVKNVGY